MAENKNVQVQTWGKRVQVRPKVLIVEDDEVLADFLKQRLSDECGFDVRVVHDGTSADRETEDPSVRLVVLDLNLPGTTGLELLQHIRIRSTDLPVIVVTGMGSVEERVRGLDAGADDYLPKPFAFRELEARIRALLRRQRRMGDALQVGDLEMDRIGRRVRRGDRLLALSPREFDLLEYLMLHVDMALPRKTIFERVWKLNDSKKTNVVDVYVKYLRRKIGEGKGAAMIRTIRGVGYQMSPSV